MRRYFASLSLFALGVAAVGVPVVALVWSNLGPWQDETGLRQAVALEDRAARITTLVLGDSMTAMAVRPDRAEVFNFASPGDTIRDFIDKLDYAVPRLPNLMTVVVQFNAETFGRRRDEIRPVGRFDQIPGWDRRQPLRCALDHCCDGNSVLDGIRCILNRFRAAIARAYRPIGGDPIVHASGFTEFPEGRKWTLRPAAAHSAPIAGPKRNAGMWISEYRRLLRRIRAHGKTPVLFVPPEDQDYRLALKRSLETTERVFLEQLDVIDGPVFLCWGPNAALARHHFFSPAHLAPSGATVFLSYFETCLRDVNDHQRVKVAASTAPSFIDVGHGRTTAN